MTEGKKLLLAAGITGSVYLGMKFLLPYVIPFFIAWLLVRLLNPVTECIRRKLPWRKEVIVSGILFLMLAVFSVVFYWFYCRLREEIRRIALNFDGYYSVFSSWIDRCCCMVEENFGIQVGDVRSFVYDTLNQADEQIRLYLVPNVLNYSVRYLRKALEAGAFVLILFVAVSC
jgi:predicted PurR-regulated permease PerM